MDGVGVGGGSGCGGTGGAAEVAVLPVSWGVAPLITSGWLPNSSGNTSIRLTVLLGCVPRHTLALPGGIVIRTRCLCGCL